MTVLERILVLLSHRVCGSPPPVHRSNRNGEAVPQKACFKVTWDHTNYLNWVIKYAKQKSHWESEAHTDIVEYGVVEKGDDNQKLVGWPTGCGGGELSWLHGGGPSGLIAGPVQQHNTLMKHRCVCVCVCVFLHECRMTDDRGMMMMLHAHVCMVDWR
jgi:hypothetical protein